jgi:hypothetical protein
VTTNRKRRWKMEISSLLFGGAPSNVDCLTKRAIGSGTGIERRYQKLLICLLRFLWLFIGLRDLNKFPADEVEPLSCAFALVRLVATFPALTTAIDLPA